MGRETDGLDATAPAGRTRTAPAIAAADRVTAETEGRYQIRRELGAGGQSRVFVAYDTHLGREIAFKQPRNPAAAGSGGTGETLGRFLREARITARLEHPNIVPVYEIGQRADGSYYCAQKLIRSADRQGQPRTLRRALDAAQSFEERLELLPHFLDVCHAIAYAHEHGVIHRDIKPENVVIGRLGETVVLDWGIAKVIAEGAEEPSPEPMPSDSSDGATEHGYAFGTPSYMGPEQAAGDLDQIDERADVWSLGAVLYEILTGRPPFVGKSAQEIVQRVIDREVAPVQTHAAGAPPALAAVAEKALEREREKRYRSAAELAGEVAAFLSGLRVGVYKYSLFELLRLFVSRHRAASAVTAVAAVLLTASSALAWWNYRQADGYLQDSNAYLADARENLARAFVERARRAEQQLQWDRAAAFYAAARVQADLPVARWGAILTGNRKGLILGRLAGHRGPVTDLDFSPDGALLATAGNDQTVRLWDPASRRELSRFDMDAAIYAIDFAPDGSALVSAGMDGSARLLSPESGEETLLYQHEDEINAVAFSPDGERVVLGTADYRVLVYDLAAREIIFDTLIPRNPIYAVAYSPSAGAIFAGGWDGAIHSLDPDSGEKLHSFEAHGDAVLALSFSPDGGLLASGGRDDLVKIWDPSESSLVHQLEGHSQKVYSVAFSPDGRLLVSGSTDKTVRLWSVATGQLLVGASFGLEDHVGGVRFSPDGELLAWVGDETVWLREFREKPAPDFNGRIESLAVSPDGTLLASARGSRFVFRDPATLEEIARLDSRGVAYDGCFSPDGKLFAGASGNPEQNALAVWDVDERKLLHIFQREPGAKSVAFSPDGSLLAVGLRSGDIEIWNTATWRVVRVLDAHSESVRSLAFSPSGDTMASGSYAPSANVVLWDTETWKKRVHLEGHSHGVRRVAFSPDGRLVATASWDRTVRLWDPASGERAAVLEGHEDYVYDLAFDPEGRYLVSAGWDGTLRVWGLEERRELAVFVTDEAAVYSLNVLPGGDALAYAGKAVHRIELGELGAPEEELERVLRESGLVLRGIELTRPPPGEN